MWTACEPAPSNPFQGSSAGSPSAAGLWLCSHSTAASPAQSQHRAVPGLIALLGAVWPYCSSALGPGNLETSLYSSALCYAHRHLVKWAQRGEILAPCRVRRSSPITSVGSGLHPSMLLLAWGFPPPYGFIPQLG